MEDKRMAVIRDKAEAEALNMLEAAEQNLRQIIEESWKAANEERRKTFKELEQKVRQIIQEAIKIAEADAERIVAQAEAKAHQIVEEAKKEAQTKAKADDIEGVDRVAAVVASGTEDEEEKRKATYKQRVELVIVPPIDMVQLEKLRTSLQQIANLRILSIWGTSDGGASILALMKKPAPLIPDLRKMDVVDEAIEIKEEMLGSDLINHIVKKNLPLRPSKHKDEQKFLVLLKRTE